MAMFNLKTHKKKISSIQLARIFEIYSKRSRKILADMNKTPLCVTSPRPPRLSERLERC